MPEVSFVIHARRKTVVHWMKLNNRMIYAVEARLVHEIKRIFVLYSRPWRYQHFGSTTSYKPVGLNHFGERFEPFKHGAPVKVLWEPIVREAFNRDWEPCGRIC